MVQAMNRRAAIADVLLILLWIALIVGGWIWADPYGLPPLDPLGSFP